MIKGEHMDTQAEQFARDLDDDGTRFRTDDGIGFVELLERYGADVEIADHERTRWRFSDGSAIVEANGAWDLGLPGGCLCWDGAGHNRDCDAVTKDY